jgi:hypothetical protein
MSDKEEEFDLAQALGAQESYSTTKLTLYIPDKDRDGAEFGTQRRYILEAAQLLARIGGGVSIMPAIEGGWLNPETNQIVWERPVVVYTFVRPAEFVTLLPELRSFLHRLGRETRQGEIAAEFDGTFYRIVQYDQEPA